MNSVLPCAGTYPWFLVAVHEEGFLKLWRGIPPALFRHCCENIYNNYYICNNYMYIVMRGLCVQKVHVVLSVPPHNIVAMQQALVL